MVPKMHCIFSSRAYSLSGDYHALRNIHPSTHIPDCTFEPTWLRDYLNRAESLGIESYWTQEAVLSSATTLAPLELMTFIVACTEKLRLVYAVFVISLHNPFHLAKAISTLDQLSRWCIEVGIDTGGKGRMFSAFEVDPASLVARFIEGLQLMKACWTGTRITFGGRYAAAARWREHDQGILEVRGDPRDFLYSKLMCWVALDRAIKIADLLNAHDRIESWRATREQIRDAILTDRDVTCTRTG